MVGVAGGLVVVILLFLAVGGGGDSDAGGAGSNSGATTPAAAPAERSSQPAPRLQADERGGKEPGRPAPAIDAERLARAAEHYARGKELWNEAQKARQAGEQGLYAAKTQEAYTAMDQWREQVSPYRQWYGEADFEGWRIPGDYVALMKQLEKPQKLYTDVRKLKQIR